MPYYLSLNVYHIHAPLINASYRFDIFDLSSLGWFSFSPRDKKSQRSLLVPWKLGSFPALTHGFSSLSEDDSKRKWTAGNPKWMEVWFRWFFLFKEVIFRFQPLVCGGCTSRWYGRFFLLFSCASNAVPSWVLAPTLRRNLQPPDSWAKPWVWEAVTMMNAGGGVNVRLHTQAHTCKDKWLVFLRYLKGCWQTVNKSNSCVNGSCSLELGILWPDWYLQVMRTELAANKTKLAQALRDVQGKTEMGSLQQLMMQHLRDTARHFCFYSLPLEVAKSLPIKQRSVALTRMLSVKGQPTTKLRSPFWYSHFHLLAGLLNGPGYSLHICPILTNLSI